VYPREAIYLTSFFRIGVGLESAVEPLRERLALLMVPLAVVDFPDLLLQEPLYLSLLVLNARVVLVLVRRAFSGGVRSGALPDHGVQRIREESARTAVEVADVPEGPDFFEVALDEVHVAPVVQMVPDLDRFSRKATIPLFPHPTNALGSPSGSQMARRRWSR